jgi:pyridinium-3,5-bisthiocarboxylic acid mononucleotide nickel chelatase
MRWLRILYFDCGSGASGDMILGALIDAGVPIDDVRRALGSLAVTPDDVWAERVQRAGIAATKFHVRGEAVALAEADDHAQPHPHDHHLDVDARHGLIAPRSLAEVNCLIDRSALTAAGKARATALFRRLGEVEAGIHGTSPDDVHLHEVGALDSIVDIVGTVFAIEALGIDRVVASPLNVGGGTVRTAHGLYPVPAPATLKLLEQAPIFGGRPKVELVTPTGALVVTGYATEYGPLPAMRVTRIGYGAGSRDFPDTPNVLRVVIGETDQAATVEQVVVIEAEIDDMNPQIFGRVMEQLLAQGALDVYYTAIQMKKNRPGTLLTMVATPGSRDRLTAVVFRETTTIGIRYREMSRERLDREHVSVATPYGTVRIKVARRDGVVVNAAPEFEDCVARASERGVPVKDVQAAATKSFLDLPSPR